MGQPQDRHRHDPLRLRSRLPRRSLASTDARGSSSRQSKTGNAERRPATRRGISLDTGLPSDLQGCFVGTGNAGARAPTGGMQPTAHIVGSPPRIRSRRTITTSNRRTARCTGWRRPSAPGTVGTFADDAADYQTVWETAKLTRGGRTRRTRTVPSGVSVAIRRFLEGTSSTLGTDHGLDHRQRVERSRISDRHDSFTINYLNDNGSGRLLLLPERESADRRPPGLGQRRHPGYDRRANRSGLLDTRTIRSTSLTLHRGSRPLRSRCELPYKATAGSVYVGDGWQDLAANLFEYRSAFRSGTSPPRTTTSATRAAVS